MIFNIIALLLVVFIVGSPGWSQGRAPAKKDSKKPASAHPIKDMKNGANAALEGVDQGIHKALPAVKEGAEKALDAVDQGVHKVIGSDGKH